MKILSFNIYLFVMAYLLLTLTCSAAFAGRHYAVIIGVSDYNDREGISSLAFVENDVTQIAQTLEDADFTVYPLCEKSTKLKKALAPTKENIERTLHERLSSDCCSADDVVLVYFSGHGVRGSKDDQKTLLLVKDSVNGDESSYLSAQTIREMLAECPARQTVLLLDACHAGGTRSAFSADLDRFIEGGVEGVLTLASCTIDQVSKKWDAKSMSFFSYWLNEGLKGYADSDGDESVSTDELFNYVRDYLEKTEKATPHGQWPVIVASKTVEPFDLAEPSPRDLYSTLDDIAEQVVTQLMLQKVAEIRFKDFTTDWVEKSLSPDNENALKSISSYASRELERRIRAKGKEIGLTISQRTDAATLENAITHQSVSTGKGHYLLFSTLSDPTNPTSDSVIKAKVAVEHTDETVTPPSSAAVNSASPSPESNSPYIPADIRIEVQNPNGQFLPRPIEKIDGALWVPLDDGEIYRIVLVQKSTQNNGVGLRLLVDGQNTIPQYMPYVESKFIITGAAPMNEPTAADTPSTGNGGASDTSANNSAETSGNPTAQPDAVSVVRPHVRLDQARFWILAKPGLYRFKGFYHDLGANAAFDEFTVAKTADHLKPGEFNDQIGLITVALYGLDRTRAPGTDRMTIPGRTRPFPLFTLDGFEIGELFECVQIRYASPAALDAYRQESANESTR